MTRAQWQARFGLETDGSSSGSDGAAAFYWGNDLETYRLGKANGRDLDTYLPAAGQPVPPAHT